MMIKRILTICAALTAGAAGTSLATSFALAQGYPQPPGPIYSQSPAPYPRGGYVVDERRGPGAPDFDGLDDDDAPNGRGSTALSPPGPPPVYSDRGGPQGPILSPNDPRYGRPDGPVYSDRGAPQGPILSPNDPRYGRPDGPAYSDRGAPQGPILSPNDPRYGRPDGPPPVIYSDRPAGPPQPTYSDRGGDSRVPGSGFIYPNEDNRGLRPPEAVGAPTGVTGTVQPPQGADGRPMVLSALPPEEQPEVGPAQLPPNLRKQEVAYATKEPAGTLIVDTPNTHLYYILGNGRAIRYGVRVGRDGFTWTGVQKISRKAEWPDWHPPTEMIERQPYLPRFMAGGPGNPLGARAMYLGSTVYRIHGTNQPSTIGKFVSSGCIGMLNEDVSDLFDRVKVGTRVVVLPGGAPPPSTATASAQPMPGPAGGLPPGAGPAVVPPLPAPVTVR
jgi:lipoprotein-anchoring transpeptidase ErfK/SrfK